VRKPSDPNWEQSLRYTVRLRWSEEDGEFIATCEEFPSLSFLHTDQWYALSGLRKLICDVLRDMRTAGETPPQPAIAPGGLP